MHALSLAGVVAAHGVFLIAALALGDIVVDATVAAVERAAGERRTPRPWDAERAAAALLAGLGAAALVGVLLSLAGVFGCATLAAVGIAALAVGRRRVPRLLRALAPRRGQPRIHVAALAAIALMTAVNYQAALAPPDAIDELAYHLPQARQILDGRSLSASLATFPEQPPHPLFGNIPKLGETLFAEGIAFGGYGLARLLHFSLFASSLLYCGIRVRRLFGVAPALLGALLVLLFDEVMHNATSAQVDAGVAGYETAAAFAIAAFATGGSSADAAVGALFVGFALSTKYSAGITAALAAIAIAVTLLRRRSRPRTAVAIATVALAPCVFWYAKNAIRFGNPTYPLLFGHRGAGTLQYEGAIAGIHSFAEPRTPANLVLLPHHFYGELTTVDILLALYLLPFALLVRRGRHAARVLVVYAFVYCAYWFWTTHQTRFLFASTLVALWLLAATTADARHRVRVALAVVAAGVLIVASPKLATDAGANARTAVKAKLRTAEARYTLGLASTDDYLERRFGCRYRAVEFIRARPSSGTVVDNWTPFHETILWLYDTRHRWLTFAPRGESAAAFRRAARRRRIEYVYFRVPTRQAALAADSLGLRAYRNVRARAEGELLHRAHLVWRDEDCRVYRVSGV